jgi:hypothetical protein
MATLTISAAARLCRCDRRTLQRAIHAGRLHLDAQHSLSREELIATGYLVPDTPHETPQEVPQSTPQPLPQGTPQGALLLAALERLAIAVEYLHQEVRQLRLSSASLPHGAPHGTPQVAPQ